MLRETVGSGKAEVTVDAHEGTVMQARINISATTLDYVLSSCGALRDGPSAPRKSQFLLPVVFPEERR